MIKDLKYNIVKKLIIIGAGELGAQVAHYASISKEYDVIGFLDDTIVGQSVCGYDIISKIEDLGRLYSKKVFEYAFIAIGYNHFKIREAIFMKVKSFNIPLAIIKSPNIYIDNTASIGEGCILYPGCIIDKNVVIKENVLLNLGVIIAHDVTINRHTFIAPGAVIAGFSKIGEKCFIGANVTIKDNVALSNNIFVGAGATITKNLQNKGIYINNNYKIK